jgi:DNA-binding winged helix-turn-helix (wHTH) protein
MRASSGETGRVIRFGIFEVDVAAGELRNRNRRAKLQELPFRLLVALLERPGEIVTREELRTRLWGETVVDFDDGLHTGVRKLRDVLGDSAAHPRFIETVPRRGYRFVAAISAAPALEEAAGSQPAASPSATPAVEPSAPALLSPRYLWIAAASLIAVAFPMVLTNKGGHGPARL